MGCGVHGEQRGLDTEGLTVARAFMSTAHYLGVQVSADNHRPSGNLHSDDITTLLAGSPALKLEELVRPGALRHSPLLPPVRLWGHPGP